MHQEARDAGTHLLVFHYLLVELLYLRQFFQEFLLFLFLVIILLSFFKFHVSFLIKQGLHFLSRGLEAILVCRHLLALRTTSLVHWKEVTPSIPTIQSASRKRRGQTATFWVLHQWKLMNLLAVRFPSEPMPHFRLINSPLVIILFATQSLNREQVVLIGLNSSHISLKITSVAQLISPLELH